MKKITLLIAVWIVALTSQVSFAQSDCFTEYAALFKDRGAKKVDDGMQNCIVAVKSKKSNLSTCYQGKIKVEGGLIMQPLMIQNEDGSYQEITAKFDWVYYGSGESNLSYAIDNGMSPVYHTASGNKVRLFFIDYLRAEPVKFKHAPDPNSY